MSQVTVQGGAAAAGSSGVLTIILGAELKRRGIDASPEELIAFASFLAPTLHVVSRISAAMTRAAIKKWFGVDIEAAAAPAAPPPATAA